MPPSICLPFATGITGGGLSQIAFALDFTDPSLLTTSPATVAAAKAYLTAKNTSNLRTTGGTVQTSVATLYPSVGIDEPRVGNAGHGQGLVIEEARSNSCDVCDPFSWGYTDSTPTHVTGPDGAISASRVNDVSANLGFGARAIAYTAATQYVTSCWLNAEQSTPAGSSPSFNTNDGSAGTLVTRADVLGAWTRKMGATYVSGAGGLTNFSVVPAHSGAAHTGACSFAFFQRENGKFATEVIITSGATALRAGDTLVHASASQVLGATGRNGMYFRLRPKGAVADYGGSVFLWRDGVGLNYVYVEAGGGAKRIVLGNNASEFAISGALNWSAFDDLEIWVEPAADATRTAWRVNGGAVTKLSTAAIATTIPSGSVSLLTSGAATLVFTSWVQRIAAYIPGARPAWAA